MSEETVVITLDDLNKDFLKREIPPQKKRKPLRAVDQYDFEGIYMRSFENISVATKELRIKPELIRTCCTGVSLRCLKYDCIFLYEGDDIEKRMQLIEERCAPRAVWEYSKDGKLLHRWPDAITAASMNNNSRSSIISCCIGKNLTSQGKIFLYKGADVNERLLQIKQRDEQNKKWRPIKEYNIDGEFVRDWSNVISAIKYYGTGDIYGCLIGRCITCQNRIFLFPEDSIEERLEKLKHRRHNPPLIHKRKIVEYTLDGTVITTWNSMAEAERYYGIPQGSICHCCNGKYRLTIDNRIFLYEGDSISERLTRIEDKLIKLNRYVR